ncbi:hypothetical protein BIZ37_24680, partial [Photobacterium sp. BZF1]|uniref:hypothetical protein n=1 Tax=Photobacterium sp. BZF1 TaxID=1904457 RepID=UPI0019C950E0
GDGRWAMGDGRWAMGEPDCLKELNHVKIRLLLSALALASSRFFRGPSQLYQWPYFFAHPRAQGLLFPVPYGYKNAAVSRGVLSGFQRAWIKQG